MTEEAQEVPKWLKELEDKRERRLKVRLGHEAGAGSPCLTCEEKCPGLDLHFWRKICKNCKCGKESHDVNDDDIYGWAQFQLLGSKPNKSKKFVLPGRKDAVELDWMPKGVAEAVESYLKELPLNLLPIKGSPAALERKQLLQKQIPLHDIDPTLCHALSENEVKQMNDYLDDVKQNSVGVGRILKLNELLISNRTPMQISQMENIVLQGANRSNDLIQKDLQELTLNDRNKLPALVPNRLFNEIDYQNPSDIKAVRDVQYATGELGTNNRTGSSNWKRHNVLPNNQKVDYQNPHVGTNVRDVNYPISGEPPILNNNALVPNQLLTNQVDNRNQLNLPKISNANQNVLNSRNGPVGNLLVPNNVLVNCVDHQYVADPGNIKDVNYVPVLQNRPSALNGNSDDRYLDDLAPRNLINNQVGNQFPSSKMRDINYAAMQNVFDDRNNGKMLGNIQIPNNLVCNRIENQTPRTFKLHDANYPLENRSNDHEFPNLQLCDGRNQSNNVPFTIQNAFSGTKLMPSPNEIDQQTPVATGNIYDINYPTNIRPNNANQSNIANIKDLAYSTYDPRPSNNPNEINATPTSVNIGLIKDIEYPTIKSAVRTQDVDEPAIPRKNVHFNLVPDEILPSCHKCNKMFDAAALVIGIERTDALWHADCFKCAGCNHNLADLMYFYDKSSDDIYCGRDYAKIRGIPRCQACDELIFVQEYCLAENSTFHVKHFCCFECDATLAGQNYVMEDSQPLCLPCFERLKAERCHACMQVIKPDEQGANLKGVHFHADDSCFVCKVCKAPLLGAKLLFKNSTLYCSAPCFGADS